MPMYPYQSQLTLGGYTFSPEQLSGLIILHAQVNTAGRVSTLRKANATSGYQVTSGKTLHIKAVKIMNVSTTALSVGHLGYGDTDVGFNSASPPTTPVWMAGESSVPMLGGTYAASDATANAHFVSFDVPATKYAFIFLTGPSGNSAIMYGYED